mmetsp:Transcript_48369/g.125423  ORF Transcript_48369/g.125423 Transcript_48369/m.125423 type:complete len:246 (+) Transcript_48369:504-1241(+)
MPHCSSVETVFHVSRRGMDLPLLAIDSERGSAGRTNSRKAMNTTTVLSVTYPSSNMLLHPGINLGSLVSHSTASDTNMTKLTFSAYVIGPSSAFIFLSMNRSATCALERGQNMAIKRSHIRVQNMITMGRPSATHDVKAISGPRGKSSLNCPLKMRLGPVPVTVPTPPILAEYATASRRPRANFSIALSLFSSFSFSSPPPLSPLFCPPPLSSSSTSPPSSPLSRLPTSTSMCEVEWGGKAISDG